MRLYDINKQVIQLPKNSYAARKYKYQGYFVYNFSRNVDDIDKIG